MCETFRHNRFAIGIAVAIVACLYAFSPNFRYASGPQASPYGGDFLQEWIGGWIVRAGDHERFYEVDYAFDLQHDSSLVGFAWNAEEYLPVVYPPFYYLAISPLSLVSLHAAAWIWAALMVAALAAALYLMLLYCRSDCQSDPKRGGLAIRAAVWIIPAATLFYPVLESLSSSQKGTLCLLILTATFLAWKRDRQFTAGMIFGLIAFKPQLALVIAATAIWKRQWRFVGGLAATGAILLGLSLCLGIDVCWQYIQFALGSGDYMQTGGYDLHKSHSVWGFAALLMPGASHSMRICFSLLVANLVVYQLARLCKGRLDSNIASFDIQFSGLVIATVLFSPHLFTYDLTILLLPMGVLLARIAPWERSRRKTTALWLLALLFVSPGISTGIAATVGVQVTVIVMLVWLRGLSMSAAASTCPTGTIESSPAIYRWDCGAPATNESRRDG